MSRRTVLAILVVAIAALGALLFGSIRDSNLFTLSAPVAPANISQSISQTTVAGLTEVSASTLLESPRYTGQDTHGRVWEVTAASADQQGTRTSATVVLNQVVANLTLPPQPGQPSRTITLRAVKGAYRQAQNHLTLTQEVQVEGLGLTLEAQKLAVDIATREMTGEDARITGVVGPWAMDITSPLLTARQNGAHLTLTKGVHAVLTPVK